MWPTKVILALVTTFCISTLAQAENTHFEQSSRKTCLKLGLYKDLGKKTLDVVSPVLKRMYERAGKCVTFKVAPGFRITRMFMNGQLDAEFIRDQVSFPEYRDTMVVLDRPLFSVDYKFVWTNRTTFDGQSENINQLSVGRLRGQRSIAPIVKQISTNRVILNDLRSAIDLFQRGRIDILALDAVSATRIIDGLSGTGIEVRDEVFHNADMYHLLRKEYAALVPALSDAYLAMLEEGELEQFFSVPGILPPTWVTKSR